MMNLPWRGTGALLLALAIGACSRSAPQAPPTPEVGVLTARTADVPVVRNYPGRLAATLTAQVRARVTGIVLQRVYKEGTDVKAGEVLFKIDPAPLQASLRQAQGQLAQAQATARNAQVKASRSKALGVKGLLAKQDVDDAVAAAAEADAAVKAARASVQNAKINLDYATVTAPISGRAGQRHPGRAGVTHRYQPVDDGASDRSDLCQLQRTHGGGGAAAQGRERRRAETGCIGQGRGADRAARRQRLSAYRHAGLHRSCRGPADWRCRSARAGAEPRPCAAARHVREDPPDAGRAAQRVPAASECDPARQRWRLRLCRRGGRQDCREACRVG